MTWFDFNWNEMGTTAKPISAADLIAKIEEWNRKCQLEARCDPAMLVDETLPCAISIGVRYVER
jgi:hypothetical protein